MTPVQVADLKDGQKFSSHVVLDKQFVLLDPAIPFSKALQTALMEWNFKTVYTENLFPEAAAPSTPAKIEAQPEKKSSFVPSGNFEQVDFDLTTGDISTTKIELALNTKVLSAVSSAKTSLQNANESSQMEIIQNVYDEYLEYTNKVFTRYVTHKELSLLQLTDAMKELTAFVKENKKYILRIQPKPEQKTDKNFLVSHCLRSTVFSIVIGQQLGMEPGKIIDLAVTTILHETGQIRLPPQLYITNKPLSAQARSILSTHTVLGFNILKECNFPASMQLGVLEHHERENGRGYPRKLDSTKISTFGKILAVACTYEAISSPRQYKEAKSTYEAIIEMLRNAEKAYDETVIKALVTAVSLFPIGAYVYLSNGKIAQVADSNPNDPRCPLVQLLGEKNEAGNPKIVMTDNEKLRIARVVNRDELKDILKYIS